MAASRTTHGDAAVPILRFLKSALVVGVIRITVISRFGVCRYRLDIISV